MVESISEAAERRPVRVYGADDVRDMDRYAIETLGVDSYLLMTRAASDSLHELRRRYPSVRRIAVLCGAGNNAGDGYVLARLALDAGFSVEVVAVAPPETLRGDAQRAWHDLTARGESVRAFDDTRSTTAELIVDAVLGTGLSREVEGRFLAAVRWMNAADRPVLSLDVPSGLNADTGVPQPEAVVASATVTFIALKTGLINGFGLRHCGALSLSTLALPPEVQSRYRDVARVLSSQAAEPFLRQRRADAHKGQHGRVLIVGGNEGMAGAVALAGSAALRSGAGTVTIACHPLSVQAVASMRPEFMCLGVTSPDALQSLIARADVVAIGPGLGRDDWARSLFDATLESGLPVVIDADGLRLLASTAPPRRGPRMLTPHPGEAAALADCSTEQVLLDRLGVVRQLAHAYAASVVVKGAGSVVCAPESPVSVCPLGNPGMATAGSGDVLTGMAAGLWAQAGPEESTCEILAAAVWLHARAGDRAAKDGQRGLLASDIVAQIRACVNNL